MLNNTLTTLPKVMIITTSRAEFGVMYWLINSLQALPSIDCELLVTGNHLVPEQGYTIDEIKSEGVSVTESVEIMISGYGAPAKAKSSALGMMSFSDVFARRSPDLVMVMGDRYELLGIVSAAALMSIPVAHFSGGEITEGVVDDTVRHAITKMAQLHFVSNDEHRGRVIQLGEQPETVFNVGELGLENIRKYDTLTLSDLGESLNFHFRKPFILFTFHPVSIDQGLKGVEQLQVVLSALSKLTSTYEILMTYPNNDEGGEEFVSLIKSFHESHQTNVFVIASLGFKRYLSALKHCAFVMGNSSSGLIEAPSLSKPTVNIGNRQTGRTRGTNVIDVDVDEAAILEAVNKAGSIDFQKSLKSASNPYGDGFTVDRVIDVIGKISWPINCRKKFYNIGTK
ncbi:UDP-N-acetylglucosamine 2-epimerase [Pseudoalteromonas aurantia]|nr:UDP-N-acetylglucosamine 2-epimerase [Pseudoalteromonas aurantia]